MWFLSSLGCVCWPRLLNICLTDADILMSTRSIIFHPVVVLIASLAGAFAYGAWATSRFNGGTLSGQYIYVVPIVVPFVAFLFDRAAEIGRTNVLSVIVDAIVVGTALMRVIGDVPFISGHALFLTYAVLRPGSLVTRITAAIVMVETLYLKFFVWHDFVTPLGGIVLALIAAGLVRRLIREQASDRQVELV